MSIKSVSYPEGVWEQLSGIFGPKKEKIIGDGEYCVEALLKLCFSENNISDQIKKHERAGQVACIGEMEKCMQHFIRSPEKVDHDLDEIILKCMLKKYKYRFSWFSWVLLWIQL